jgi:hypothetical protein
MLGDKKVNKQKGANEAVPPHNSRGVLWVSSDRKPRIAEVMTVLLPFCR